MPSFVCDACQETLKKQQLDKHFPRCRATFSCIDCYRTFAGTSYRQHTSCITEVQKYHDKTAPSPAGNNIATPASSPAKPKEAASTDGKGVSEEKKGRKSVDDDSLIKEALLKVFGDKKAVAKALRRAVAKRCKLPKREVGKFLAKALQIDLASSSAVTLFFDHQ